MAKVKMGRWEYTEHELETMFDEATVMGKLASAVEPQAKSVRFDREANRVIVDLKSGATFIFPCELVEGLRNASADEISRVELGPRGASLHWEKLGVDFSIAGLMSGIFGTKEWMVKLRSKGGSGKSSTALPRSVGKQPSANRGVKRAVSRSALHKRLHSGRAEKQP